MTLVPDDALLPASGPEREIARSLYDGMRDRPIISPHGHCDPSWFALNERFPDPARLFVVPDHYVLRMLVSQGARLEELGVAPLDGGPHERDGRTIWRHFAEGFHLFRGTPSGFWIEHSLQNVFGIEKPLTRATADEHYDSIDAALATPAYRPRALFDRFGIEVLATTDGALDDLAHHAAVRASGWSGRIVPTYRPDAVVDPQAVGFPGNVERLGAVTGEDVSSWPGYLTAHRVRRGHFIAHGATATDHGHPTARTLDLPEREAAALFDRVRGGNAAADDAEAFRAQMLTEFARMSLDDGLVMQLHAGSMRGHSPAIRDRFGADKGFDIPRPGEFVEALGPLLDAVGLEPGLTLILFTLDETTYARELAPLAGAYPALRLGPPWWFHDSPEGMRRFRERTTETAGFYNTAGFNDDTRAFCSIPARHDMARRCDAAYLAGLVATGRLREAEAHEVAGDLAYGLAKRAYRL